MVKKRDPELEQQLAASEADVKAGRVSRPYRSARALVRDALRAGNKQLTVGQRAYAEAKTKEERAGRLKGPSDAKTAAARLKKLSKKHRKK